MKADVSPSEMYVKDDTLYLSGTKWTNNKDMEANLYNLVGQLQMVQ